MGDFRRHSRLPQEAAGRRQQAASWLQGMVGPLDLPIDSSEEEFRLCLQDGSVLCRLIDKMGPGTFSKVQETDITSGDSLRKFLRAAAEVNIPTFEVHDLEQPNYRLTSSESVVDCILSLKGHHKLTQGKGSGALRQENAVNPFTGCFPLIKGSPVLDSSSNTSRKSFVDGFLSGNAQKSPSQHQRRWVISEFDNLVEGDMPSTQAFDENFVPNSLHSETGPTSAHIHHISQKFREILRMKTRGTVPDLVASESPGVLGNLHNSSPRSLSSLVSAIIGDKQQDEVPALVEFLLKKVMEEFERRLITQSEQVMKLKNTLKEQLNREDRLASRALVLETLAAGTGEEVKIVSNQLQKLKMEKKQAEEDLKTKEALIKTFILEKEEHQAALHLLEEELKAIKDKEQGHITQLELQNKELKFKTQEMLNMMRALQKDSDGKLKEARATFEAKMVSLKRRDQNYQACILSHISFVQGLKLALKNMKEEFLHMQGFWCKEMSSLDLKLREVTEAASGYHKVLAENRQLYNEVQDLKGNIRVYCRVRPPLPGQGVISSSIGFIGENGDIMIANPTKPGKDGHKMFSFNKIFGPSATQEEVFMDTRPLIQSVLDGYNVCIFAYGQTGSGKTYTMSGPSALSKDDWGVNYRALNDLFDISKSRKDVFKYEVGVQMVEIYNEQVRDLLLSDGPNKKLEIRYHSYVTNGLNVPDASMLPVNSTADVWELIKVGERNRAVGATALNKHSSRSHSVLTVHVQGTDLVSRSTLRGCLHLVDLAGSERVDKSEATGDRLREAQHINKSLSALGDVISALAQKSNHVPYRNSKLTQLLQDSLGGQAKTLMFVHISPEVESYGETVSTLKFAERVASVELGSAQSNKESREVRELRDQVSLLKEVAGQKDAEINRLQSLRRESGNEISTSLDKKMKYLNYKPFVEPQHSKSCRQAIDIGGMDEDRVQKSTDSSLFGTSSADDISLNLEGFPHAAAVNKQSSSPPLEPITPHLGSIMDDRDKTRHASLPRMLNVRIDSLRLKSKRERKRNLNGHTGSTELPELDACCNFSDDEISHTETEISFSSAMDPPLKMTRKDKSKLKKATFTNRKPPPPQLPVPTRHEWRSLKHGLSYSCGWRHSVAVSPDMVLDHAITKKRPSIEVKHAVDASTLSDGGSQDGLKSSKRWL